MQAQQRYFYQLRPSLAAPERWIQVVGGKGEDKAMRFTCFWLPLSGCPVLIANMGDYLHLF